MAQIARPTVDTTRDNWTTQADGTTSLFGTIDEVSASEADYIKTGLAPTNDVYVTKLGSLEDPQSSSGHVVRWRYQKDAAAGATIELTTQLRQGYTNEGSLGTLIASHTDSDVPATITAGSITLSGAEADSITDYTSLYLRWVANQV